MADYANMFQDIGGAVSDLFGAVGAGQAASGYKAAAASAEKLAGYATESTAIQEMQTQRKIEKTLGSQLAGVAAAGFTEGGSSLDLLRESTAQGALQRQVVETQGAMNVESYHAQAQAYIGQEKAAEMAQKSNMAGGILKGLGALASFF